MKKNWNFKVWGFFAAVYLASGLLWIPILISGQGMSSPINMLCMALIAFVPSTMGILFTYLVKDRQGRRDFWRRAFRWPRASGRLVAAALLILPVINIASYTLSFWLAGWEISLAYAKELFSSLPLLLEFLFVEITFGALSEELGWRGYLLDEMQSRWGALASALVLGVLWGLWHTPTFLVPGLAQYQMGGIASLPYLSFILGAVASSVLQTWAYNNTGRSTLVAGFLMHFLANASLVLMAGLFDQFSLPEAYWIISTVIYLLAAVIIVIIWGPRTMSRKRMDSVVPVVEPLKR